MNRNNILYAIIILIFLIGCKEKRYNWHENYKKNSKEPYGTKIIYKMLLDFYPDKKGYVLNKPVSIEFKNLSKSINYIFIGKKIFVDSLDTDILDRLVKNGSNVFIACEQIPDNLTKTIFHQNSLPFSNINSQKTTSNFFHTDFYNLKGYTYHFKISSKYINYNWKYIRESDLKGVDYQKLGYVNLRKNINFLRINRGKGAYYIHTIPILFSNYNLITEENFNYVKTVFTHLKQADIYWDNYSNKFNNSIIDKDAHSPLKFILSQRAFRWAWYLMILTAILFVIYRAKRRQSVIAVVEENKNTSIEFAEVVGELYLKQKNHKKLANLKIKYFLTYVRNKYKINAKKLDVLFVEKLSSKSGVKKSVIADIVSKYLIIKEKEKIDKSELIELYKSLEIFYKNNIN